MLRVSAATDGVAVKSLSLLLPLYRTLQSLQTDGPSHVCKNTRVDGNQHNKIGQSSDSVKPDKLTSIKAMLQPCSCVPALQVVREAAEILRDPFGHGTEDGFSLVARQSETPDWWTTLSVG